MTQSEHAHTARTQDEEETIVMFRKYKDEGDIIALFPGLNHASGNANYGHVMSYMHVGQHSEVDYTGVIYATKPATEPEYQDLADELTSLGYNLRVVSRKPSHL